MIGIGASDPTDAHSAVFEKWIVEGRHAGMQYLERILPARLDLLERFPWVRSVISIAVPYESERPHAPDDAIAQRVARYALGDDYHDVLDRILRGLEEGIRAEAPDARTWRYVDTGPVSDRAFGAQAGLGWIGRNAMLIDPEHGSWFLLGTLLTSLENDVGAAEVADRCGDCTRCVDACPTDAILPDRTVASGRCISYLTIEHRGAIDPRWQERLEGNLFGCDICQEVCPWNDAPPPSHPELVARQSHRATPISDLLRASQAEFSSLFRRSAVKRAKRAGMIRNAILIGAPVGNDLERRLREEGDPGIDSALEGRREN